MAVSLISLLLIVGTLLPAVARASIISDIIGAINISIHGNIAEAETVTGSGNVQTMQLPKAGLNAGQNTGGTITVVDDSALVSDGGPAGTVYTPKNLTVSTHLVKEGETISGIAASYDVSPDTIRWANNLSKTSVLKSGQSLTILPVTGTKHTVKKGDTLAAIAKKYDGDATEIASYNGVDDTTLVIGSEVIIPNGEIQAPPAAPVQVVKKSSGIVKVLSTTITNTISAGYYSAPLAHYIKTQGIHGTNGVDIVSMDGVNGSILAAAEGDVVVAMDGGYNGGYGSYVVIQHDNGSQTLYSHMSSVSSTVGEHVVRGQVIGYQGRTGKVTGPTGYHLHFEIRNGIRNPF